MTLWIAVAFGRSCLFVSWFGIVMEWRLRSDFSKMLAEGQATEDQAQKEYDTLSKDNEVATATKTTEAEYKTKDSKETAARLAGLQDDKGVAEKEYSAIME